MIARISNPMVSFVFLVVCLVAAGNLAVAQQAPDFVSELQTKAIESKASSWGFWGTNPEEYSSWTSHSNRLIPVYTWGLSLDAVSGAKSLYRQEERIRELYGAVPEGTLNPSAEYFDQTDIYRLQKMALEAGKKNVILMVFDGMDWPTSRAAAIYNSQEIFTEGRGSGLHFLDYRAEQSGFGFMVTTPHDNSTKFSVDGQGVIQVCPEVQGGYCANLAGSTPWSQSGSLSYLLGSYRELKHCYTDSSASATSMISGIKTYNGSVNIDPLGKQVRPIAYDFQDAGYSIGVVTSVPISHATPACTYAHNVNRGDYQDLTRDLLGLKSITHRDEALPGVDVLIGCGWGETYKDDRTEQGLNFVPGNRYLTDDSLEKIDVANGGRYVVAQRTKGKPGRELLIESSLTAASKGQRLFGFFGTSAAHLPYRTANGDYVPTLGVATAEKYDEADLLENPTLADMAEAALNVLSTNEKGFWMMIEAGDVDWANHSNNIDDSIGAVISGDMAFRVITDWVERHSNWEETAIILTADHGHLLVLKDPTALIAPQSDSVHGEK